MNNLGTDFAEIFYGALINEVIPALMIFLEPILLWIILPGLATLFIFKNRNSYYIGSFIGAVCLFTFGPLSSNPLF